MRFLINIIFIINIVFIYDIEEFRDLCCVMWWPFGFHVAYRKLLFLAVAQTIWVSETNKIVGLVLYLSYPTIYTAMVLYLSICVQLTLDNTPMNAVVHRRYISIDSRRKCVEHSVRNAFQSSEASHHRDYRHPRYDEEVKNLFLPEFAGPYVSPTCRGSRDDSDATELLVAFLSFAINFFLSLSSLYVRSVNSILINDQTGHSIIIFLLLRPFLQCKYYNVRKILFIFCVLANEMKIQYIDFIIRFLYL